MNDPLALLVMVQETVFFSVAIKVSAKKVGFVSGTENNPRSSSGSAASSRSFRLPTTCFPMKLRPMKMATVRWVPVGGTEFVLDGYVSFAKMVRCWLVVGPKQLCNLIEER